ncbi:MAG: GDSL-type esterase/lipase family protein [Patescibacteria group bacterium]
MTLLVVTVLQLSLGLLLLGVAWDILRWIYFICIGRKMAFRTVPYERIIRGGKHRFLFVGDSTTAGTGAIDNRDSIAGRFGTDFPDATIINRGVVGQKLGELSQRFDPREFRSIDLMVIQIGGNDIVHPVLLADTKKHLRSLLKKATSVCSHVIVLHCGNAGAAPFWPWYLKVLMEYRTLIMREAYRIVILEFPQVEYVDLYRDIKDDPFIPNVKKFYAADMFHPSGFGYEIWYLEIRELMDRLGWDFGQASLRTRFVSKVMKSSVVKKTRQFIRKVRTSSKNS